MRGNACQCRTRFEAFFAADARRKQLYAKELAEQPGTGYVQLADNEQFEVVGSQRLAEDLPEALLNTVMQVGCIYCIYCCMVLISNMHGLISETINQDTDCWPVAGTCCLRCSQQGAIDSSYQCTNSGSQPGCLSGPA